MSRLLAVICVLLPSAVAITCYNGLKIIQGTSIGDTTIQCDNSNAQCYNMTANTGAILDITKAGCSMWRCMLARDRCISTTFQNIPISLCCCSGDRCNVEGNQVGFQDKQKIQGGLNAAPESSGQEPQNMVEKPLTKEMVEAAFAGHHIDDEVPLFSPKMRHEESVMGQK